MTSKAEKPGVLLPCPFCGSREVSHSLGRTGDDKPWPYVECENCGANTEPDDWNKRAPHMGGPRREAIKQAVRSGPWFKSFTEVHPDVGAVEVGAFLDEIADAILALPPQPERTGEVAAACEPWKNCSGDPPDWESPLMNVWQAAICWTLQIVGKRLGATEWEGGDGSETLDGDVGAEVGYIMRAAGLVNSDGDPITREDLAALSAASPPPAGGWEKIESAPKDRSWILVWSTDDIDDNKWSRCAVVQWRERGRTLASGPGWFDDRIFQVHGATYWHPLPSPPIPEPGTEQAGRTQPAGARAGG